MEAGEVEMSLQCAVELEAVLGPREYIMSTHALDSTMTVLTSDECYRLLGTRQVGRLGVIAEHYPLIIPVNYAMDEGIVVIRSRPGLKSDNLQQANVTFQVDHLDEMNRGGWSVLVRGQAEEVTDEHSERIIRHTHETGLRPYAPGTDFHWIRIIPHGITGRRIVAGAGDEWEYGTGAYM